MLKIIFLLLNSYLLTTCSALRTNSSAMLSFQGNKKEGNPRANLYNTPQTTQLHPAFEAVPQNSNNHTSVTVPSIPQGNAASTTAANNNVQNTTIPAFIPNNTPLSYGSAINNLQNMLASNIGTRTNSSNLATGNQSPNPDILSLLRQHSRQIQQLQYSYQILATQLNMLQSQVNTFQTSGQMQGVFTIPNVLSNSNQFSYTLQGPLHNNNNNNNQIQAGQLSSAFSNNLPNTQTSFLGLDELNAEFDDTSVQNESEGDEDFNYPSAPDHDIKIAHDETQASMCPIYVKGLICDQTGKRILEICQGCKRGDCNQQIQVKNLSDLLRSLPAHKYNDKDNINAIYYTKKQKDYVTTLYNNENFQLAFRMACNLVKQNSLILRQFVAWNEWAYDKVNEEVSLFLHEHCKKKEVKKVEALLLSGANANKKDKEGHTSLSWAEQEENTPEGDKIIAILLKYDAKRD